MKKKLLVIFFTLIIMLSACAAGKSASTEASVSGAYPEAAPSMKEMDMMTAERGAEQNKEEPGEKMIERYALYFQSEKYEESYEKIQKAIEAHDAYLDGAHVSNGDWYGDANNRSAWFLIRVEADKTQALLAELRNSAHLVNESLSKENVTAQYNDLENRKEVLLAKEERLLALMEKAETMEDLIVIESSLGETIAEKENLIAQINDLDQKVSYRFVEVDLQEVRSVSYSEPVNASFGARISRAFSETLARFVYTIQDLVISLVYGLPYLLFFGVIVVVVILFTRKIRGHRMKEKTDPVEKKKD